MAWDGLAVSALEILLTITLATVLRQLVSSLVKAPFPRQLLLEAIASAELCGCCFELVIVADNFGVSTYAVFLFLLTILWSQTWGEATACPYTHIEDLVENKTDYTTVLLITCAELTGGILIFKYIQVLWSLELTDNHKGRAFADCTADLQVSMLYGAIIEGIATCMCRVASKSLGALEPKFGTAIDSFIATSLVVAAFNYSGGYFNPVLATSLKFGCAGHTVMEHMVVYWIGACLGAVASVYIYHSPPVQDTLKGYKEKLA